MPIKDHQLLGQKVCKMISVLKTNTGVFLPSRQNVNQNAKMNYFCNIISLETQNVLF